MKYVVFWALLSTFTLTTATPLQVNKDLESENLQELLASELSSSTRQKDEEKESVANRFLSLDLAIAQDCDWTDWLKCGGLVVTCAASCYTLIAPACITCLGSSYSQCAGCVSRQLQIQKQGEIQQAKYGSISTDDTANAQGCGFSEWYECGSVVVRCAKSCYDLQAASCISCAGNSYYTCRDCFSRLKEIEMQRAVMETKHVADAQGCGYSEWYKCGSVVVRCAKSCYDLRAASCIGCAGDSYYTCKDCFSRLEEIEMQGAGMKTMKHPVANAQGCGYSEWYKCGSVVVRCAKSCYDLQAASCISCAGDSHYTCKDCFSRLEEIEMQGSVTPLETKHDMANAQGCGYTEWFKCGSVVVRCAKSCYNLKAASCISCAGNSYYTCKDCFSRLEEVN